MRLRPAALLATLGFAGAMTPGSVDGVPGTQRKSRAISKDLPFIACDVCRSAVRASWLAAQHEKERRPEGVRVGEDVILLVTQTVCQPLMDVGEWILHQDIVQSAPGRAIRLEEQDAPGICRRECMTIAAACNAVFDDHREDIAELLYKGVPNSLERLQGRVCTKWAKVCPAKPVPAGYERPVDEAWYPMDEDDYKIKRLQGHANLMTDEEHASPVNFLDPGGPASMLAEFEDEDE
eukprot:TRINITY_DN61413_c0_g1_i1.p2 TRINITY_DN61413_c0_g1~~TRINITY_DN61413_c0_g1_i1.p2  ORF type:complete len:263 (+),score=87.87 TRINITY_DN61413_c0_g1_i1:83-790(+)